MHFMMKLIFVIGIRKLSCCYFCSVQLEKGTVTFLIEENGTVKGVTYKSKSGEELIAYAPLTIVCDGCFSNLRRVLCAPKVKMSTWTVIYYLVYKENIYMHIHKANNKVCQNLMIYSPLY